MLRTACLLVPLLACAASASPPAAGDELYADYDALLRKHVDAQGLVDYEGLIEDRKQLNADLGAFREVDSDAHEGDAQKAFWINVYNAVTLRAIVDRYPIRSIKELAPDHHDFHIWEGKFFQGKSLNDIEHKILRPLGDARIHAAIVCASHGCPPLRNEAYLPSKLHEQLEANVRAWLAHPKRGLKVEGKVAYVSKIFEWFGEDFAPDQAGRLAWIEAYVDDATRLKLTRVKQVEYLEWSWALNKQ
jgi:hypothetical protein